jgi:hypothetical protein
MWGLHLTAINSPDVVLPNLLIVVQIHRAIIVRKSKNTKALREADVLGVAVQINLMQGKQNGETHAAQVLHQDLVTVSGLRIVVLM